MGHKGLEANKALKNQGMMVVRNSSRIQNLISWEITWHWGSFCPSISLKLSGVEKKQTRDALGKQFRFPIKKSSQNIP